MVVSDGFTAIANILGLGSKNVFGSLSVAALFLVTALVGFSAYIGADIVLSVMLGGLLAIGFAFYGWLPFTITLYVTMVLWSLGFAYFIIMFYNR